MGLVVPNWMVPLSLNITLFLLHVGSPVGGFLLLDMWLTSFQLEVRKSVLLELNLFVVQVGAWFFFRRSFKKVRLSEKIRRPIAHGVSKVFNSQSLDHDPLEDRAPGNGRRVARRSMGYRARVQGGSRRDWLNLFGWEER